MRRVAALVHGWVGLAIYANATNTVELDAWNRFDIGARHRTEIGGSNVVFRASVENIADDSYWESATQRSVTLSAPRTFKISATVGF